MRRPLILTLISVAALTLAKESFADDTDALESLLNQSIVTTASTQAESASSAPATSVTLTAEDLQTYGIRSIAEAIQFLALGVATSDPLRTPDMGARGVLLPDDEGKHFLLLVNGHAINDPLYGAARFDQGAGIPIDVVDHIEVIVGPGSVLYGSNAMLGVINVITKSESDYQGGHAFAEYEPGRTARVGAGAGFHFRLFGQKAAVTAAAEYYSRFGPDLYFAPQPPNPNGVNGPPRYREGGPADGVWGGTVHNAYFTQAPMGHVSLHVGDFAVNVAASTYRYGIPYTFTGADVDFDEPASYVLERALRLDVMHSVTPSSVLEVTSRVYADGFDRQSHVSRDALQGCFRNGIETCEYYTAGRARWVGLEERLSFNWLRDSRLVTLIGIDGRLRWVSAKQDQRDPDTGAALVSSTGIVNGSAALVSPYVQQTYRPLRWLDLNAGARLDADSRTSPIVSPRGAIAVKPLELTTLKLSYSQAFRAPTWDETDSSGFARAKSPALRPEIVRSVETSVEQRFSTQRVLFGAFWSRWEDLIQTLDLTNAQRAALQAVQAVPITTLSISQYRNVATLTSVGWNASWDGTVFSDKVSYGVNVTEAFTRADSPDGSLPLPASPSLFGNARLAYAPGGLLPTTAFAFSYLDRRLVDRAYRDWPTYPTAPALAQLRAIVSGKVPGVAGLAYRVVGSYSPTHYGAYAAGIVNGVFPGYRLNGPTLTPVDRYSVLFGLRYDFGGPSNAVEGSR